MVSVVAKGASHPGAWKPCSVGGAVHRLADSVERYQARQHAIKHSARVMTQLVHRHRSGRIVSGEGVYATWQCAYGDPGDARPSRYMVDDRWRP
jgi:hypothetical protein